MKAILALAGYGLILLAMCVLSAADAVFEFIFIDFNIISFSYCLVIMCIIAVFYLIYGKSPEDDYY